MKNNKEREVAWIKECHTNGFMDEVPVLFRSFFDAGYAAVPRQPEASQIIGEIRYVMNSFAYKPEELSVIEARLKCIEKGERTFTAEKYNEPLPTPYNPPAEAEGVCECGHHRLDHRDRYYDADQAGSLPGQGRCQECIVCTEFKPAQEAKSESL